MRLTHRSHFQNHQLGPPGKFDPFVQKCGVRRPVPEILTLKRACPSNCPTALGWASLYPTAWLRVKYQDLRIRLLTLLTATSFLKVSWGWAANFFCQTFWKVVETKLPQLNVTKTQPFLWTFTNPKKSFKNCIFIKVFPDQETVLSSRRCPRLLDWGAQLWNFPPGR